MNGYIGSKRCLFRTAACLQIVLQVSIPAASCLSSLNALADSNTPASPFSVDQANTLPGSNTLSTTASALSSQGTAGLAGAATSTATNYAASSVQEWLSHFGTAQVQLNVDDNGKWDNSSIDFLAPIYDNKKSMLFTQLGMRAPDGRVTGNLGAGVRTFYLENWMFGGNFFFDDDFTGENRRFGVGAEAWTNNLKFAANTYVGTSNWHDSDDLDGYYEKPADGFDVRAEGYLPAYPQLGAKLMYEKYYGDNVALFDTDHLQNNPSAVTVGVNYTPIPLITAAVDYKRGQDSMDDTRFSLNFRYAIGQSLQSQLEPSQVAYRRSLMGSRYDLVDRNNEIVLQYKKKETNNALSDMTLMSVKDNSPADGTTTNSVMAHAVTSDGSPAKNAAITWAVSGNGKLSATTGVTDDNGDATVNLTDGTAEEVTVSATSGSITRSTPSDFVESVAALNLKLTQNNSAANGTAQNKGQVTVKDTSGKVLSGIAVKWQVNNGSTIVSNDATTDANGIANVAFTNTKSGAVKLTASASGKTESVNSAFTAAQAGKIAVTMKTDNALSDGASADTVQAVVTDSNGTAMPNTTVTWSLGTGSSAKMTSAAEVKTDANGVATLTLTDPVAESVTVNATADDLNGSTTATFTAVPVSAIKVTMTTDKVAADGKTSDVAQAVVTDASGKAMANTSVTWSLGRGSAKNTTALKVTTDANGIATLNLTDTVAESVDVTASAGGKTGQASATFTAVPVSAITVSMTTDKMVADGTTADVVQAVVTDASGNAMANENVTWSLGSGSSAKTTSALAVTTDANGIATLNLTDTVAEGVTVNASTGDKTGQTTATFIAVPVSSINVSMKTDNVVADGTSTNVAQAVVKDGNGNAVANEKVTWSLGSGNSAKTTSALEATTDASGVATLSLTDTVVENVNVTATASGNISGQTTAHFSDVEIGPVTVYYPTASKDNSWLNINAVRDGLRIVVNAWPGMAAGDKVSVHFVITGELDSAHSTLQTLPDYTSETHTVTADEVGSNLTFTVPEDQVMGLQPETYTTFSSSLVGTATGTVIHSSPDKTITSDPVSRPVDTVA